jgi:cytochrome c oxidase cbb3-type subunit 1
VRDDATLRFMVVAAIFYGLSTFEGSFLAIRAVNSLSHYTDWTVGHVHAGALGWVAFITFGSLYTLVPAIYHKPRMYSNALVEVHFWLALSGTLVYVFAMWNSGITQGLMWRTYTDAGTLSYSFVDSLLAMWPYYVARTIGGLLFLLGVIVATFNIWMTVRRPTPDAAIVPDRPIPGLGDAVSNPSPAE